MNETNNITAKPVKIAWHPELPIYAADSFLNTVSDDYGWIGGTDNSGKLRCVLPYTIIRKVIFRMVRFRVETISLGKELTINEEKSFLNSVMDHFRSTGADMVIPATTNTIFRTYPDGAIAVPYGSYIIDLSLPEKILWKNLHSKHRNVVRSATKKGVEIKSGSEYIEIAYELIQETLKRTKLGFMSYQEFKKFVNSLRENIEIFIAIYQGVIQGCAVVPFSEHSAYYVYGGSIAKPVTGAINLLHWEAILEFQRLGVKRYDFVGVRIDPKKGSKQMGLMKFKERFGGQLVRGFMWKYSLHPLRYRLYCLAARLRSGGDIVDQERHKHINT